MIRGILLSLALTACSDPYVGAGIVIGPEGVAVAPVIAGSIGGVGVTAAGAIN